jgi:hypothetical protein
MAAGVAKCEFYNSHFSPPVFRKFRQLRKPLLPLSATTRTAEFALWRTNSSLVRSVGAGRTADGKQVATRAREIDCILSFLAYVKDLDAVKLLNIRSFFSPELYHDWPANHSLSFAQSLLFAFGQRFCHRHRSLLHRGVSPMRGDFGYSDHSGICGVTGVDTTRLPADSQHRTRRAKAYCALPDPTVVTAPFGALGIAWSNSGNKATKSLTRLDLALSKMTAISNLGKCC